MQIYLPDLKYYDSALSARYSAAPDYFAVAAQALREMFRQVGPVRFDKNGMLQSGWWCGTWCCREPIRTA